MDKILDRIQKADKHELELLRTAVLNRYQQVYPDWEISILSVD